MILLFAYELVTFIFDASSVTNHLLILNLTSSQIRLVNKLIALVSRRHIFIIYLHSAEHNCNYSKSFKK